MKIKGFIILSVFILLSFSLVSAVEFNLNNNFSQGETIIAKISGNFINSLTKDNIFFYKEHVRIPIDYGIEKINKEYYLYASLSGKTKGNYSVSIENAQYLQGAETLSENIIRNFSITNTTASFSLKPGAIVSSGDFSLELQNLKDNSISITVKTQVANDSERDISITAQDATAKTVSVSLVPGEVGKIYFKSGNGLPTFQKIELSSGNLIYEVPVYIFLAAEYAKVSYRIEPLQLISSIPTNSATKKIILIYNEGDIEIRNISLSLSDSIKPFVNLSHDYIESLGSKANFPVELSFFSLGEIEVSGTLKANINSETMLYSQISLKFLDDYISVIENQSSQKTCEELSGKVCILEEACDKQIIYTKDSVWCCPGNCKPSSTATSKKSPAGTIVAIIIFIVLIGGGIWFYKKKYQKAKKPVDLLKIAKGEE